MLSIAVLRQPKRVNNILKRHAFLILTDFNLAELKVLLRFLDDYRNDIYVHVDSKVSGFSEEAFKDIVSKSRLFFTRRTNVSWGAYSIIQAEYILMKAACHGEYDYYHLISGKDLPLKTQDYIHNFFDQLNGQNLIDLGNHLYEISPSKFSMRYQQYHLLQNKFVKKERNVFKYIDFASCYFQKFIGVARNKDAHIKSGSEWVSLTKDAVQYIVDHERTSMELFKYSYCCDELYKQTLLFNAGNRFPLYRDPQGTPTNLRSYDFVWHSKHDLSPRIYSTNDIINLVEGPAIFGRKFDIKVHPEAVKKLAGSLAVRI